MTQEYLQKRADKANINDIITMLSKVPDREPIKGDEL